MIFSCSSSSFIYVLLLAICMMMMMLSPARAAAIGKGSNITCGPSGVITADGSPSGAALTAVWSNDFRQICLDTLIRVTSSSSNVGAQKVCGVNTSVDTAVDIGILSRPFRSSEATTTDGYTYKCTAAGGGKVPRTAIQVEAAIDAVVLVVTPNGQADYCIQKLFGDSLSVQQLRFLYTSYPLAKLVVNSSKPTTLVKARISPDAPTTFAPVAPSNTSTRLQIHAPVNFPTLAPYVAVVGSRSAIKKPTKRPTRKPTARPTVPQLTIKTVSWAIDRDANGTNCSDVDALIAGPPPSSEAYEYFATKVLPNYGKGERISSRYYAGYSTAKIVSYVQKNTNAIAFLPLKDYLAYQTKVAAVNIQTAGGTSYGPNKDSLRSGLYPLGFNIYMEVRSNDGTTLRRVRPFFQFAYSALGDADVLQSGLVPVSESRKKIMLGRLGAV